MNRTPPSFKTGAWVYFKIKQPSKCDLKWRPGYRIVQIEHNRHFLCIENQATGKVWSCNVKDVVLEQPHEFWNIDTQFWQSWKIYQLPCEPTYHKSLWLIDVITHTFSTVNNWHSSSLQHDVHDHPQYCLNYKGNRRSSSFSTCFESLSDMPFMDYHCIHITSTHGISLEIFQQTIG